MVEQQHTECMGSGASIGLPRWTHHVVILLVFCCAIAGVQPPAWGAKQKKSAKVMAKAHTSAKKGSKAEGKNKHKNKTTHRVDAASSALSGRTGRSGALSARKQQPLLEVAPPMQRIDPADKLDTRGPALDKSLWSETRDEALVDEKLDEEIRLSQELLNLEKGCGATAAVRFRIADLYWIKSKRAFFKSQDAALSGHDRTFQREQMKRDQATSVKHYETLLDVCPDSPDYAKVLFYLGKTLAEGERLPEATLYFKRVIREFPKSEWAANAWFMVGEYYFNVMQDANRALDAYIKAAATPRTSVRGYALYMQGWCYINLNAWQRALDRFGDALLVAADARQPMDDRTRKALRREALKDVVRAYAHVGNAELAYENLLAIGGPEEVIDMMHRLGGWYREQGAHRAIISVYRQIIAHNPKTLRLAEFKSYCVDAMSRLRNRSNTAEEVRDLAHAVQMARTWHGEQVAAGTISTSDEAAWRKGEELAENTMRRLALEGHKEAKKLLGEQQEQAYGLTIALYDSYFSVFAESPLQSATPQEINYQLYMNFYYADALYEQRLYLRAAEHYDVVMQWADKPLNDKEKQLVMAAAEEAVRAYDEAIRREIDKEAARSATTQTVAAETKPMPIPPLQQKLLDACIRYVKYVGPTGDKFVEVNYKMARVYYAYNHFAEAVPVFREIVDKHPTHPVACYAANLLLDILNGQGDLTALVEASRGFQRSALSCGEAEKQRFAQIEAQAEFHRIDLMLKTTKNYQAAGAAYQQFFDRYPEHDLADDALYNAASGYELARDVHKANSLRVLLSKKKPKSPLVPDALYAAAQSYERGLDFVEAASQLERFSEQYPNDKRSRDALFNATLYRDTLGEREHAQEDRRDFLKRYGKDPEAHGVRFAMCEADDQAAALQFKAMTGPITSKMTKAIKTRWSEVAQCYGNFANGADASDADRRCQAEYRRAKIMVTRIKANQDPETQQRTLWRVWEQWRDASGANTLPRCAAEVAEMRFNAVQSQYQSYRKLTIAELDPTPSGKRRFDASLRRKVESRDAVLVALRDVVAMGVPEWSLAALYLIGEAYGNSIEALLNAPIPHAIPGYKLTKADKEMLRQQLREMTKPIEALEVEAYQVCLQKATEIGVHNRWSVRSRNRLQELQPQNYPAMVERRPALKIQAPVTIPYNPVLPATSDPVKGAML